jgi:hypothetical protein
VRPRSITAGITWHARTVAGPADIPPVTASPSERRTPCSPASCSPPRPNRDTESEIRQAALGCRWVTVGSGSGDYYAEGGSGQRATARRSRVRTFLRANAMTRIITDLLVLRWRLHAGKPQGRSGQPDRPASRSTWRAAGQRLDPDIPAPRHDPAQTTRRRTGQRGPSSAVSCSSVRAATSR